MPEGLLVDSAWLTRHGYSTGLRSHYLSAGWLEQPARRVYRRPRGDLAWQQVVISLQTVLGYDLTVGGRTALELQGYAHYLAHKRMEVHVYGPRRLPTWVPKLPLQERFVYHNDSPLFRTQTVSSQLQRIDRSITSGRKSDSPSSQASLSVQPWGQWNWPLVLSTPERALLELLDELPRHESFHQVDQLVGSLSTLSPRRLQILLTDCLSIKVKRLLFFFADRHRHAWVRQLDKSVIDLGKGKRMLVRSGKLDPVYQITVPEDLDGVR